jgi:hypothetical protein
MRPIPARILLSALIIGALTAGALTSQLIFYVAALMAAFLLATTLSTSRNPVTRALLDFRNCPVEVRIWGAPPPLPSGASLVLTSVNVLGPGFHVFFQTSTGSSIHLKVAQPTNPQIAANAVVVVSARYVQWEGKKISVTRGGPAVSIARRDAAVLERQGSGVS